MKPDVSVSICDIAAGMTAHQAIMQALYARNSVVIELSLFHALLTDERALSAYHYGGRAISVRGYTIRRLLTVFIPAVMGMILLSIQNEREWMRLAAEVLENAGIATDLTLTAISIALPIVLNWMRLSSRLLPGTGVMLSRHGSTRQGLLLVTLMIWMI